MRVVIIDFFLSLALVVIADIWLDWNLSNSEIAFIVLVVVAASFAVRKSFLRD